MPVQIESQQAAEATNPNTTASVGSGAAEGAAAGSAFGPWGTAAGAVIGGVAGWIGNNEQNNAQVQTQGKLDAQQLQYTEQLQQFENQQQYEMWLKTNYPEQVRQLEAAGLNPALEYHGATVGTTNAMTGTIQGATAPNNQVNIGEAAMQGTMQLEQMKLLDSQAQLNQAQADKIKGVDTKNVEANTNLILANTTNVQANTELTKVQTTIQNVQAAIATATENDAIAQVHENMEQTTAQANDIWIKYHIDKNTQQAQENAIQQTYSNMLADKILKDAQAKNIDSTTALNQFEQSMNQNGITKDSPWYVKMIGLLATKLGLNPLKP